MPALPTSVRTPARTRFNWPDNHCSPLKSPFLLILVVALGLSSFAPVRVAADGFEFLFNKRPAFVRGEIVRTCCDGETGDLLTADLGITGIQSPVPPALSDPPTPAELRRVAIYTNYRALLDVSSAGGFGRLYGPPEEPVRGDEFVAFADDGSGRVNVTMMVQIPNSFDPHSPCIITGPSSGSRGVYGAIGTSGEAGLTNGCAVVYTDKGTGTGFHDLELNTVHLIGGEREDAVIAGKASNFTAPIDDTDREAFLQDFPHRFAVKHAHSGLNPEKNWGKNVLQSVVFGFYVLNQKFGIKLRSGKILKVIYPFNTAVVASSVSNGGGASVLAAEQDRWGLIDGVAVSEPNVNPRPTRRFSIRQGDGKPLFRHSRSLYDYSTALHLYQGCASLDPAVRDIAPFNFGASEAICDTLAQAGLVEGDTTDERAASAQAILNDHFGILPEQNLLMPAHWFFQIPQAIAVTYANAYSRSSVLDNACGYSFAAADPDGVPAPLPTAQANALYGTSGGIPPTGGVALINNLAPGGALRSLISTPDQNTHGALCLRSLGVGRDAASGNRLTSDLKVLSRRVQHGITEVRANGRLNGRPTIFVTGRSDAILPPNHTSRAYFGLNRLREGRRSQLRYYEVVNAQHLDLLNGFAGFDARYVPLHVYFVQAVELMLDHLRHGSPLPPSQVVRTLPRGLSTDGSVPDLEVSNVPPLSAVPPSRDRISFVQRQVRIPD